MKESHFLKQSSLELGRKQAVFIYFSSQYMIQLWFVSLFMNVRILPRKEWLNILHQCLISLLLPLISWLMHLSCFWTSHFSHDAFQRTAESSCPIGLTLYQHHETKNCKAQSWLHKIHLPPQSPMDLVLFSSNLTILVIIRWCLFFPGMTYNKLCHLTSSITFITLSLTPVEVYGLWYIISNSREAAVSF